MTTPTKGSILRTDTLSFLDFIRYPDIAIPEGGTTFISGESGTGKSTLLRLYNNSLAASSGSVYYRGTDILAIDPVELRRSVLLAGQSTFLFDDTIAGNFAQFFNYRDEAVPGINVIEECLSICCLDFSPDVDCSTLSGGERQRVYLALFLAMGSDILMLDEPTSALDAGNGRKVMENISTCCRNNGRTLIVVSHDESLIDRFAEHRVILSGKGQA